MNYTVGEYAADIVAAFQNACGKHRVPEPTLMTESGLLEVLVRKRHYIEVVRPLLFGFLFVSLISSSILSTNSDNTEQTAEVGALTNGTKDGVDAIFALFFFLFFGFFSFPSCVRRSCNVKPTHGWRIIIQSSEQQRLFSFFFAFFSCFPLSLRLDLISWPFVWFPLHWLLRSTLFAFCWP